jgi:predicted HTH transcriptional regulator
MGRQLRKKSQEALDFLEQSQDLNNFISWSVATEMLANQFGWTAKTASNRIHELIEVGALERVGNFERPTPREPNGVDNRKIRRAK